MAGCGAVQVPGDTLVNYERHLLLKTPDMVCTMLNMRAQVPIRQT